MLVKGRRPVSGSLAPRLTASQGEFCQNHSAALSRTMEGLGVRLPYSVAHEVLQNTPPAPGTSSPSAAEQKGWAQGGILPPAVALQPAWSFPLAVPSSCSIPAKGLSPMGWVCGAGERLEQEKGRMTGVGEPQRSHALPTQV